MIIGQGLQGSPERSARASIHPSQEGFVGFPNFGFFLLVVFAVVFYKIGELEYHQPILCCGISIGVWMLTSSVLGWGFWGCIMGQVGIFAAMTAYNMSNKRRP